MKSKRRPESPEVCPHCGADVPRNALACPECGSDHETGWSEHARIGGLNLPDEEFNYDEFVKREFGPGQEVKPHGVRWLWWAVAVGLLALALARWLL